jgi:hypothetical protein
VAIAAVVLLGAVPEGAAIVVVTLWWHGGVVHCEGGMLFMLWKASAFGRPKTQMLVAFRAWDLCGCGIPHKSEGYGWQRVCGDMGRR